MNKAYTNYILSLGKVIVRATSDWDEAETIIGESGVSGNRKASAKGGLAMTRKADQSALIDAGWSKQKVARISEAAKVLNAYDLLIENGAPGYEQLEATRLCAMEEAKAIEELEAEEAAKAKAGATK